MTIPLYSECKGGSSRVGVAIRNISKKIVVISKGQHIANVTAANQVPNMLAPKYVDRISLDNKERPQSISSNERQQLDDTHRKKLWEQLDITGSETWTKEQKASIRETFEEFHNVFALNPLELGQTSLVQHSIKITDPKPFKERYRQIPPHQFEEV